MKTESKFYSNALIIALVACTTLIQQIILTRIFSAELFYHFAFAAVSLTLLGMTIGAIRIYVNGWHQTRQSQQTLLAKPLATYFYSTLLVTVLVATRGPIIDVIGPYAFLISLILIMVALMKAFIESGSIITLLLTGRSGITSKLYAADLCGAGLGCWLTMISLDSIGLINSLFLTSFLAFTAFSINSFNGSKISFHKSREFFSLICFGSLLIVSSACYNLSPKTFYTQSRAAAEYEKWNSYSRILVTNTENKFSEDLGISSVMDLKNLITPHKTLTIDAAAKTVLTPFDGDFSKIEYLRHDITASPFALRKINREAIIGVGGGRDILIGLLNNTETIIGIEVNASIYKLLSETYADFIGNLYTNPKIKIVNDEARGYIARLEEPLDLIQISLVDTWAATASGAFGLTENGLYTEEAWQIFYNKLSDHGILSLTRWYHKDTHIGELYRLLSMANNLMKNNNVSNPQKHIAIIYYPKSHIATLMFSKSAIQASELQSLKNFARKNDFEVLDLSTGDINNLITKGVPLDSASKLDLSPPTDNRPFFFNMVKHYTLASPEMNKNEANNNAPNNLAVKYLIFLIFVLSILSTLIIFIPLIKTRSALKKQKIFLPFFYFSMIGLGFMFVEIPLIQYLSLYLGRPSLGLSVGLFGILTASGTGSYLSQTGFLKPSLKLFFLTLTIAITSLVLPIIIHNTYILQESWRIIISLIFLLIMGLWMGMAFPLGLNICKTNNSALLPWLWAVNGGASVIGSTSALLISIFYGISEAMLFGALCYALAMFTYIKMNQKTR